MRDGLVSEHIVAGECDGMRLDAWAAGRLPGLETRNAVKKAIKRGEVEVDGIVVEPQRRLRSGQWVRQREPSGPLPKPFPKPIEVVFEDEHLAVVLKPAGLRVNGPAWQTLENALPGSLRPTEAPGTLRIPRVAHRLDQPTQGLVVCAKTATALVGLGWAFERREVRKTYRALALGRVEGQGSDAPLDGRIASSRWEVMTYTRCLKAPAGWLSTVVLQPTTGRRHQLRRHLAERGWPILGDGTYTPPGVPVLARKGLFLAAVAIGFEHPVTGACIDVSIPEPPKFESYRARESRRWLRHHPEDA